MAHKAIAIIPARGGSKRIPRKNLVDLGGKPLIAYSIETAKKSIFINSSIYVSTEDEEIAELSKKLGVKVIERSTDLASDSARTLDVLKQAIRVLEKNGEDFDTVVLLQATCPFRKTSTIDSGIEQLWDNWAKYDVIFSIRPSKFPPNWLLTIKNERLELILPNDFSKIRSQDLDQAYEIDGVLYVYKKDHLMRSEKYPFAKHKSGFVFAQKTEAIDIDDFDDLEIARAVAMRGII